MSLTSYRAAPPRDKPLRTLSKTNCRNGSGQRFEASIPSGGFLRRQPLPDAGGVAGLCINARLLWKGPRDDF
jgi:hypothetical protein